MGRLADKENERVETPPASADSFGSLSDASCFNPGCSGVGQLGMGLWLDGFQDGYYSAVGSGLDGFGGDVGVCKHSTHFVVSSRTYSPS